MTYAELIAQGLTPGKLVALRRIANPNGTLTMLALDQNNSIIKMAKAALARQGQNREPTYGEIVAAKANLVRLLAPKASAVLLDAAYGAWHAVAMGHLPHGVGLLVRLEKSGTFTTDDGSGRVAYVEDHWSVEQIKRMGADAVKLLVFYEPSHKESAAAQRKLVRKVARECRKHDILLLLETLSYQFKGEAKDAASYLDRKPGAVVRTARHLSRFCDIYKAEFPGTLGRETEPVLQRNLEKLNTACARPWVLLSAGVDYPLYRQQVRMALEAGASGALGGRAFWKEYFDPETDAERCRWLEAEAAPRLAEIDQIVRAHAQPWFERYGWMVGDFARISVPENWYVKYGSKPTRKRHRPCGDESGGEY